jgi:hypothetical protein
MERKIFTAEAKPIISILDEPHRMIFVPQNKIKKELCLRRTYGPPKDESQRVNKLALRQRFYVPALK